MAGYNIEKINFLVVDDNKHMRSLVTNILHSLGSRLVSGAANGVAALKKLDVEPTDIVICDWKMSPMNGIEFVKKVRSSSDSTYTFIPIIMLTGYSELDRVMEARDAGVNEFMVKPISAKGLYMHIRAVIENPRPFLQAPGYFGPDRRRKIMAVEHDRRKPIPTPDDDDNFMLSREAVEALLKR